MTLIISLNILLNYYTAFILFEHPDSLLRRKVEVVNVLFIVGGRVGGHRPQKKRRWPLLTSSRKLYQPPSMSILPATSKEDNHAVDLLLLLVKQYYKYQELNIYLYIC